MPDFAPRICILGGGFGGLYAALHLNRFRWRKSHRPRIILVDGRDRFSFTPLLYERLTHEVESWQIAPKYRDLLAGTEIAFEQDTVRTIDLHQRRVDLQSDRQLTYDRLVIALGGRTPLAGIPGVADSAFSWRNFADARRLDARLQQLESSQQPTVRIAIAGGGPNGVELAGKLSDRLGNRGELFVIDRHPTLLKSFSRASRKVAMSALAKRGVSFLFETSIEAVEPDRVRLANPDGRYDLPVDLVVWAIGTQPVSAIDAMDARRDRSGRLLTRPTLQLADYPDVFALGDAAAIRDAAGTDVPMTAQAAHQASKVAARNLKASLRGRSLQPFRYRHLGEMLALGIGSGTIYSFGILLSGRIADMLRKSVYLTRMPTFRHQFAVARYWVLQTLRNGFAKVWQQLVKVARRV